VPFLLVEFLVVELRLLGLLLLGDLELGTKVLLQLGDPLGNQEALFLERRRVLR